MLSAEETDIKSPKYEDTGFLCAEAGRKKLRPTELFKWTWSYLEV